MTVTCWLLRARSRLTRTVPLERQLAELASRVYPAPAPLPKAMRERYDVRETTVDGCLVLRLTPRDGATGQHLIYTHGGSYVHALVREHWWLIDRSTRGSGVTITLPFYRLAPEGGPERAYALLRKVYAELAGTGSGARITLAGDSAGGGLALGRAIAYRDAGAPALRQVVLFSPWVDVALTNPAIPSLQPRDPVLDAEVDAPPSAASGPAASIRPPPRQPAACRPDRPAARAHLSGRPGHPGRGCRTAGRPVTAGRQFRHRHFRGWCLP